MPVEEGEYRYPKLDSIKEFADEVRQGSEGAKTGYVCALEVNHYVCGYFRGNFVYSSFLRGA